MHGVYFQLPLFIVEDMKNLVYRKPLFYYRCRHRPASHASPEEGFYLRNMDQMRAILVVRSASLGQIVLGVLLGLVMLVIMMNTSNANTDTSETRLSLSRLLFFHPSRKLFKNASQRHLKTPVSSCTVLLPPLCCLPVDHELPSGSKLFFSLIYMTLYLILS